MKVYLYLVVLRNGPFITVKITSFCFLRTTFEAALKSWGCEGGKVLITYSLKKDSKVTIGAE